MEQDSSWNLNFTKQILEETCPGYHRMMPRLQELGISATNETSRQSIDEIVEKRVDKYIERHGLEVTSNVKAAPQEKRALVDQIIKLTTEATEKLSSRQMRFAYDDLNDGHVKWCQYFVTAIRQGTDEICVAYLWWVLSFPKPQRQEKEHTLSLSELFKQSDFNDYLRHRAAQELFGALKRHIGNRDSHDDHKCNNTSKEENPSGKGSATSGQGGNNTRDKWSLAPTVCPLSGKGNNNTSSNWNNNTHRKGNSTSGYDTSSSGSDTNGSHSVSSSLHSSTSNSFNVPVSTVVPFMPFVPDVPRVPSVPSVPSDKKFPNQKHNRGPVLDTDAMSPTKYSRYQCWPCCGECLTLCCRCISCYARS